MSKRVLFLAISLVVVAGIWPLSVHWTTLSNALSPSALASKSQPQDVTVEQVIIQGNRRIPESTISIWITTRKGEIYSPVVLDRDVRALYAQGHFSNVKVFAEDGATGGKIVTFVVEEWPLILDVKYHGLHSVEQSKILDEYRKRQVGLTKDSQYDPVKAKRAAEVVKDLLADEGHPDATVTPQIENISKTAVVLTFEVNEGERVRIADIEFEGNKVFTSAFLRRNMKYTKEVGIFTTFSSKDIYNKEKLQTDLDRLRVLVYADHGYLKTHFGEPKVEKVGQVGTWLPIVGHKGEGIKIVIQVNEGRQYTAGKISVEDNTEFTADQIKSVLAIKPGEIVRGPDINKGMENLKKIYGTRGYIQFDPELNIDWHDSTTDPEKGVADLNFRLTEGKQFTLHRLDFIGNTFTRDSVLRREVLFNEGERYNQQLWDLSLLRLNQLGFFDQIKPEDATVNTDERKGLVDLTLKVQEKGRQQISFTGGVAGIGGSFVGINYSTNNLLGFGESVSVGLSVGNLQKSASFGFTEPYLRGKPISLGFSLFASNYAFLGSGFGAITDQSILSTFNSNQLFTEKTAGGSVSVSAPLSYFAKRFRMGRFVRLGLSYQFSSTNIADPSVNQQNNPATFVPVTFHQKGVTQSTITPSFTYNTLNSSLDPTRGKSLSLGLAFSGGPLGGKVNTLEPTIEYKSFRPLFAGKEASLGSSASEDPKKTRALGYRIFFGHIALFGTRFESNSLSFINGMPLTSRFYLGGDQDLRAFNIRSISPLVPIIETINTGNVFVADLSGNRLRIRNRKHATPLSVDPSVARTFTTSGVPAPAIPGLIGFPEVPLGGDSELLGNLEYRIPIIGPVAVVPFFDIGSAFNLSKLSDQAITSDFIASTTALTTTTLDPRGTVATRREIRQAKTPESGGNLPPGFRTVQIMGSQQTVQTIALTQAAGGFLDNYRYSFGAEIRVQVPVINVPFRLIFGYNPNANVNNQFVLEQRHVVRFSVGRTF